MLTILVESTRECLVIHVDRHSDAQTVHGIMQKLIARHGQTPFIRGDKGSVPMSETSTYEAIYGKRMGSLAGCDNNHL